jgi:hexulose-6-phosphate isomerase
MRVGITGLVTPSEWSFDELLENVKRQGYEVLEMALRDEGYFTPDTDPSELQKLPERAREAGIELVSVCPAISHRPRDVMTDDQQVREASIHTITDCMAATRAIGTRTMLLVLGTLTPDLYYDRAYENALEALRKLAPRAEEMGVNLSIEYVWNKFLLSPLEFARFLDQVDSPSVGFYFDPGNMCAFSYPKQWVRLLADHLMAVHMKDFQRSGFEWKPLGEGDVDFPGVMRELRRTGYDGPLVSEVAASVAPYDQTARAIREIMQM